DRVRTVLAGGADGRVPGAGTAHVATLVAQRHREQVGQVGLVVDHEDADRLPVGSYQSGRSAVYERHAAYPYRNSYGCPGRFLGRMGEDGAADAQEGSSLQSVVRSSIHAMTKLRSSSVGPSSARAGRADAAEPAADAGGGESEAASGAPGLSRRSVLVGVAAI